MKVYVVLVRRTNEFVGVYRNFESIPDGIRLDEYFSVMFTEMQ